MKKKQEFMRTFAFFVLMVLLTFSGFASGADETKGRAATNDSGPVNITFWHYWDGANGEVLQSLIDKYETEHPSVSIQAVFVPGSELGSKLQTAIVGKETPTMAIADLISMPMLTESQALVAMDSFISSSSVDMNNYFQGPLVYGEKKGKRYSLPVSASNLGLFWNKEIFKQAGLDPEQPPRTWAEMAEMASVIKNKTGKWGFEIFSQGGEGTSWQWQVFLWANNGEILSANLQEPVFDSNAGIKALKYWISLIDSGVATVAPWGLFGRGEAAMVMDGSWMTQFFPMQVDFELGSASFPYPEGGQPATNMGGEQVFIFEGSEKTIQAAWDFIEWFSSTDVQIEWCKGTGFMPILRSVAESNEYIDWINKERPLLLPFVQSMEFAHPRPPVENYSRISDILASHIVEALYGRTEADKALHDAADKAAPLLK